MSTYDSPTDVARRQRAQSDTINNLDAAVAAAFARLPHEDELTGGTGSWGTDTGTANTYLVELPYPPSSYVDGLEVSFRPLNTNTGASTINVNSLGVKNVKRSGDLELYAGDLSVGLPVQLRFSTATDCFHFVNTIVRESSVSGNEADIAANAAGVAANVIDTATNTAGVATNAITTANFDTRNDRDDTAITLPTIGISGGAVDHTINTDGSADISFDWTWTGTETDIDGFIVYVRGSSSSASYAMGTTPAEEVTFHCMAGRRSFILKGIGADLHWTWGVSAYRIVDPDVAAAGKLASAVVQPSLGSEDPYQPSANIAFGGNVTGTVNSQAVSGIIYHNGTKLVKTDDSGVDADDLDESVTKKWAAESGADVTLDQLSGKGINICHPRYSSFEEAALPPVVSGNGTVTQDSGISYFGGNSLKMAASAADHYCYFGASATDYNVKITPNKKWIISSYNRCDGISKDLDLYVRTKDSGNHYHIDTTSHGTANTWKRVSGIIDLTSDDSTQCIIRLDNDGGNGVNMWWDGIMLEEQFGNLEVPSAYALPSAIMAGWDSQADNTGTAIENSAASMLYNWNLTIPNVDEMPAGIYPVANITDFSQVDFLDSNYDSIKILSTPDTTVAYGFPAIPIDDKNKYTITIRHKSSAACVDGLHLRLDQYNADLPVGKTHIGDSDGGTNTQTRTNYVDLVTDGAMPGTSWVVNSYTYTPISGTKYASFAMYNNLPATAGVEYHVDYVLMYVSYKEADNTEFVNDSETEAGHHYDCYEDILMRSGADISFYIKPAAVQVYIGRMQATAQGIWIYSSDNPIYLNTEQGSAHTKAVECKSDFIPYTASDFYLGDATHPWKQVHAEIYYAYSSGAIRFYNKPAAVQVYMGKMAADANGIWIYGSDNNIYLNTEQTSAHSKSVECKSDFIPWSSSDFYLGNATYRWARAYVDAYYVGTTAGCDFNGAVSNITVVKGLVTAAS